MLNNGKQNIGGSWWLLVLLVPYLYQLNVLLNQDVVRLADSFRYLWTAELRWEFFTASSQTVRAIYYLLGNEAAAIAPTQLALGFLPAVTLFLALKRNNHFYNLSIVVLLAALSLPNDFLWYHRVLISDSIFTSLLLGFTALLFGYTGPARAAAILAIGTLFIFSRNVGPYVVIAQLLIYAVSHRRALRRIGELVIISVLLFLCAIALWVAGCCDTTKEINVADNLYSRVFHDPERVDYFHENYDMPVGPFVQVCTKGHSNVNTPCFDHESIYTGDPYTRQYRLTQDRYGFADWVRERGMQSWQHYLLFGNPLWTLQVYRKAYDYYASDTFADSELPYDLFPILATVFGWLGMLSFSGIIIYLLAGAFVYFRWGRDRVLGLGLAYIISALVALFIGFFGDSEELDRYTYPAMLCLYWGLVVYMLGMSHVVSSGKVALGRAWQRDRYDVRRRTRTGTVEREVARVAVSGDPKPAVRDL